MRLRIFPIVFLLLPLAEIATFVVVGRQIGVLATLGLVVATSILGIILMRIQGFGVVERIRQTMNSGGSPGRDLVHGMMVLVAGVLLLLPGFLTDIVGLLLFVPAIRDIGWRFVRSRVVVTGVRTNAYPGGPYRRNDDIVDLDSGDYTDLDEERDPLPPHRRIDHDDR